MRITRILVIAAVICLWTGCGGGGGDLAPPTDARPVSLHLYPRTIYTIAGKPVELSAQAVMDDGSIIGVNGACRFFIDDPSVGTIESGILTGNKPGVCKVWAVFEGVASEERAVIVDDEGDLSIDTLDSAGQPARHFRLNDSLYYSGKGLEPFSPYNVELTDPSGNILTTLILTSDAWGNIPLTPIWLDVGVVDSSHEGGGLNGLRWGEALGSFEVEVANETKCVAKELVHIVNNDDPYIIPAYDDGSPTNTFHPSMQICVKGGNFPPGQQLKVLVIPDRFSWANGDAISGTKLNVDAAVGPDGAFSKALGVVNDVGAYDIVADIPPLEGSLGPEDIVNGVLTVGFTVQDKVQPGMQIITQAAGKKDGISTFHFADVFDIENDDVYTWVNPPIRPFVSQVGKPRRYIVDHKETWNQGDQLLDITSVGEQGTVEVGCWNSPPVLTDPAPHNTGKGSQLRLNGSRFADVILDTNNNAQYDPGLDILDNIIDAQDPDLLELMGKTGDSIIPPGVRTVQVNGLEFYQIGGIYISDIKDMKITAKYITDVFIDTIPGQGELEGQGTRDFIAKALYKNGDIEDLSSKVEWHTSNPNLAVPMVETPGRVNFISPGKYEVWAEYKTFTSQRIMVNVAEYAPPVWESGSGVKHAKYIGQGNWRVYFDRATDVSAVVNYKLFWFEEHPYGDFSLAVNTAMLDPTDGAPDYDLSAVVSGLPYSTPVFFGLRASDKFALETDNSEVYYADPYVQLLDLPPGWLMYGHDAFHTSRADFAGPVMPELGWSNAEVSYSGTVACPTDDGNYFYYVMAKDKLLCLSQDGEVEWDYYFDNLQNGDQHLPVILQTFEGVFVAAADKFYHIVAPGTAESVVSLPGRTKGAPTVVLNDLILIPCEPDLLVAIMPGEGIAWQLAIAGMAGVPAMGHNDLLYVATGSRIMALNPLDGIVVFSNDASGGATGPVIADDGTIYLLKKQELVALTPVGDIKWKCPVYALHDHIFPPAIGPDGQISFPADEGLYGVTPDGKIAFTATLTFSELIAPPTVDTEGRIYLTVIGTYPAQRFLYIFSPTGVLLNKSVVATGYGDCQPNIVGDGVLFVGSMMLH